VKHTSSAVIGATLALSLLAHSAFAQSYTFQDIGSLGGATVNGLGLNASGQAAGIATNAAGNNRAFFYDSSGIHDLGLIPGASTGTTRIQPNSGAVGINASGQVAGFGTSTSRSLNAFVHTGSGPLTSGDVFGTPGTYSQAIGLNNAGVVVGSASFSTGQHAFLYDGVMHDLGALSSNIGVSATAYSINTARQVVGISVDQVPNTTTITFSAFRTGAGGAAINPATDNLGTLGGADAQAVSINNVGTAVGFSNLTGSANFHGFATPTGRGINAATDDLGVLAGYVDSYANNINASGLIAGYNSLGVTSTGADISPIATLFIGGKWLDLNTLLPADFGYTLTAANAVNDSGQVLAVGLDSAGAQHTFLLSPVVSAAPEPSQTAALGLGILGLAGLMLTARRRKTMA